MSYQPSVGQPAYSPAYHPGGYAPRRQPRHGFKTFLFAALIALIPFVGTGASAIYVAHSKDPENFDLGAACGAAFVSFLATLGFFAIVFGALFVLILVL